MEVWLLWENSSRAKVETLEQNRNKLNLHWKIVSQVRLNTSMAYMTHARKWWCLAFELFSTRTIFPMYRGYRLNFVLQEMYRFKMSENMLHLVYNIIMQGLMNAYQLIGVKFLYSKLFYKASTMTVLITPNFGHFFPVPWMILIRASYSQIYGALHTFLWLKWCQSRSDKQVPKDKTPKISWAVTIEETQCHVIWLK